MKINQLVAGEMEPCNILKGFIVSFFFSVFGFRETFLIALHEFFMVFMFVPNKLK
jgi:hypothetical protein